MKNDFVHITVKGKWVEVPALRIGGKTVVCTGKWIKKAEIHDEEWSQFEPLQDADTFIMQLRQQGLKADYFTFAQKITDTTVRCKYPMEWDNAAAISIVNFSDWWEHRLPQVTRKNVRRAVKKGVVVRRVEFTDEFVRSIVELFNETLVKQGMPFAHHGKDFATVKREHATMLDRSEFLGAYHGDELVGFIKLVYLGKIASILNINTKDRHYDKRPANALIAQAVQVCEEKGFSFLTYGKYTYGNKTNNSLTEYKRRNGFEKIEFPRYYVPLTFKGSIFVGLRLYRGLLGILPSGVINLLLGFRSLAFRKLLPHSGSVQLLEGQGPD